MAEVLLTGALQAGVASLAGSEVQVPNPDSWDQANQEWGQGINVLSEDKPVFILESSFFQEGDGVNYGGVGIPCRLVRTGLTITGKGRKGEWTVDTTVEKTVTGVWPVIKGTPGTRVFVRLGAAPTQDSPIQWDLEREFIVGTTRFLDYVISGVYLAVSFRSVGQPPWELLSYELEMMPVGQ